MATYATTLAEGFSQKVVSLFFEKSIAMDITNQDYEGEIKDKLSKLNILTFGAIGLKNYTGSALSADDATESVGQLETDQQKAYYFKIQSIQKFHSWIKNPEGSLLETIAKTLRAEIDTFVLSFWGDVASGNRLGTSYTTGTVAVTATTGAVVGTGTTFTSAMVGLGFKAAGMTSWYRVKTFTDTTHIVIEDDKDDVASAYTGGAISAGAAYEIEAVSKLQTDKDKIYGHVVTLAEKLNKAQVPMEDRFLVVSPEIYSVILQSPQMTPAVSEAYQSLVLKGYVGDMAGFKVMLNNHLAGDNTNGFKVMAVHKSFLTFAMGWVESGIEDLIGDFGKAYKGLNIYGAKVVDERRKAGAYALLYV